MKPKIKTPPCSEQFFDVHEQLDVLIGKLFVLWKDLGFCPQGQALRDVVDAAFQQAQGIQNALDDAVEKM